MYLNLKQIGTCNLVCFSYEEANLAMKNTKSKILSDSGINTRFVDAHVMKVNNNTL